MTLTSFFGQEEQPMLQQDLLVESRVRMAFEIAPVFPMVVSSRVLQNISKLSVSS